MKVKNILFKANLIGDGIVNFDSNDQKFIFNGTNSHLKSFHKNTSYAKKNFYKKDGEDLTHKLKISSDCLKNAMFKNELIAQSPKTTHDDVVLYSYIASPMSLVRGYMFANKKETLKRSGALTICDAEQTCDAVSFMETFSKSGEKTEGDIDVDKSDNTFFKKESVGKIAYSTFGNIDVMKLQFISADQVFDRYAFNPDKFSLFKTFLNLRLPNFNSELGYYKLANSVLDIPEYGVKLSTENLNQLIKDTLLKLLSINIKRKGAYAEISSLKVKLVYDPLVDTLSSEDNWIELKSVDDIEALSFEVDDFYNLIDLTEATVLRESIEASLKAEKAKDKESSAETKKVKSKTKNTENE